MAVLFTRDFILKVPKSLIVFYSEKQAGIVFQNYTKKRFIGFLLKLYLNNARHFIYVTNFLLSKPTYFVKDSLAIRAKYFTLLKKGIIEVLTTPNKKIFFFGIGFKVSFVQKSQYALLKLTLGFSHDVFIAITTNLLEICCLKFGNFLVFSNFYNNVYFLGSKLLSIRKMNPYKLKGFSYEHKSFFTRK